MRTPKEMPGVLGERLFTVYDSDALGVSRERLRHVRVRRISRAIRALDRQDQATYELTTPERVAAYTGVTPFSWLPTSLPRRLGAFPCRCGQGSLRNYT